MWTGNINSLDENINMQLPFFVYLIIFSIWKYGSELINAEDLKVLNNIEKSLKIIQSLVLNLVIANN